MKRLSLFSLLLLWLVCPLSAKKKVKIVPLSTDTCCVVDSTAHKHEFAMIWVGEAVLQADSVERYDFIADNTHSDSLHTAPTFDRARVVEFFVKNIVYPNELKQQSVEGSLKIRFRLDKTGKVQQPEILHATYPEMEKEALRVVGLLPEFLFENLPDSASDTVLEIPISFKLLKL